MKKNKLSDQQIVDMLNETSAGEKVESVCRKYGLAASTYYQIKKKYGGMQTSELKRLKALEEENRRLKAMYADMSLDHKILKELIEKKYPELIGKG